MPPIAEWLRRLWYRLNRRRMEEELRQELLYHREALGDVRKFGSELRIREDARAMWGWNWLDAISNDIRLAARGLLRTPAYSVTVVASLALGFGLVSVAASVIGAYAERALPYPEPHRLFHVMYAPPGPWEPANVSRLDWVSVRDVAQHAITARGAHMYEPESPAVVLRALRVDTGFVRGLHVRAMIGRTLTLADYASDAEPRAMISYALWRNRLGGDTAAIGQLFRVDESGSTGPTSVRVIGVLPPDFYFGRDSRDSVQLLLPLQRAVQTYMVRLQDGVSPDHAALRLTAAVRALGNELPADWAGVTLESVHDRYVASVTPILRTIGAASIAVLLIVLLNASVLAWLRAIRQQRAFAIRAALGASRLRLARLPACEALLLSISGVAIALLFARVVCAAFASVIAQFLGRPGPLGEQGISLDARVIFLALGLSIAAAIVLTVVVWVVSSTQQRGDSLRTTERSATSTPLMTRVRSTLTVLQLGMSIALLIWCGLMLRSTYNVVRSDRGFSASNVVKSRLAFPAGDYPDVATRLGFLDAVRESVRAASGDVLTFATWPPFFETQKQRVELPDGAHALAGVLSVSDGYFAAMGIPVLRGRDFSRTDQPDGAPVAVVSAALADRLWPAQDVVGRTVRLVNFATRDSTPSAWFTVVGVVGDVRQSYADTDPLEFYTAYRQAPPNEFVSAYMRSTRPISYWTEALPAHIARVSSRVSVSRPIVLSTEDREGAEARFMSTLLSAYALFAAVLAVIGIVGVSSYAVHQRRREMAIRMALGASARSVRGIYMTAGLRQVALGVILGLVIAMNGGWLLANRLHGVNSDDPVTILVGSASLALSALLAIWLVSRRAGSDQNLQLLRDAEA